MLSNSKRHHPLGLIVTPNAPECVRSCFIFSGRSGAAARGEQQTGEERQEERGMK